MMTTIKGKMEKSKETKKVISSNMWAIFNYDNPNYRYQKFLSYGRPAIKSLIESIILYDEIVVPTQDFMSLVILIGVLGEKAVINLLESHNLKFIRINGGLAYIGNGGGINSYEISSSDGTKKDPFCAPIDETISWALNGLTDKVKDPSLITKVIDATSEIIMKNISEKIKHETYMDVINSPYLSRHFALRNHNMNHLVDIKPNEIRIYGGPDSDSWKGDEIDIVMLLATTNLELFLACNEQCNDLISSNPVGHILKAKAERSLNKVMKYQNYAALQEIASIPDIGEGILNKQYALEKIIKLKQSKNGKQFREWFHSNCRGDTKTIAKEYIRLLRQEPIISSLPARIIRFITTSVAGSIPGVSALVPPAIDVIDSFFLDKWLQGHSPKIFIDELKQVAD